MFLCAFYFMGTLAGRLYRHNNSMILHVIIFLISLYVFSSLGLSIIACPHCFWEGAGRVICRLSADDLTRRCILGLVSISVCLSNTFVGFTFWIGYWNKIYPKKENESKKLYLKRAILRSILVTAVCFSISLINIFILRHFGIL